MKKVTLALVIAAFAFTPLAHAEDAKPAGCCKKAATTDKACTHGCCVSAAKDGKHCEKCGGKNAPKAETGA